MENSVLILGSGSSLGVPVIGCSCAVCTSEDPKNKRTRSSILLQGGEKNLLIDVGPDVRMQALRHKISHLDGLIITHAHHDHTAGLDDLRLIPLKSHQDLPCLLSKESAQDVDNRFYYLLHSDAPHKIVLQHLSSDKGEVDFCGMRLQYFTYQQQKMNVQGFRWGDFAYVTDIKTYDETVFDALKGVKILVLSALRFTPTPMHFSVDDAIDFIYKVSPQSAYLTHLAHELDYEKTNAYLPKNIQLAFDGLKIHL